MVNRCILIFPACSEHTHEIVDQIRQKHDPLWGKIKPHMTLVFPFESELKQADLIDIVCNALKDVKPFKIRLNGFKKFETGHLYLDIEQGKMDIIAMATRLYADPRLAVFRPPFLDTFMPHITVGHFDDAGQLAAVYEEVKKIKINDEILVDSVAVEIIGPDEISAIENTFRLK
jgi:2'-5' RNA ligase